MTEQVNVLERNNANTGSTQVVDGQSLNEVVEAEEGSGRQTGDHLDDVFRAAVVAKDLENVFGRKCRL